MSADSHDVGKYVRLINDDAKWQSPGRQAPKPGMVGQIVDIDGFGTRNAELVVVVPGYLGKWYFGREELEPVEIEDMMVLLNAELLV